MRYLSVILVVLFANLVISSQTDSPAPQKCPMLDVTLSSWAADIGEILTATATLIGTETKDLKFTWSIAGGIILEGQGKPEIKVKQQPEHAGKSLTVSATTEGISKQCPAISGSASTDIIDYPPPHEIDRYKKLGFNAEKARLDRFVDYLLEDNTSQALIAVSFDRQTSEKRRDSKIKRIFDYLTINHKIAAKRILFAVLEEAHEETVFWRVPLKPSYFPYNSEKYKAIKGEDLANKQTPPKSKSSRKKLS